jgi:methionine-rich copper-binding protein CopC
MLLVLVASLFASTARGHAILLDSSPKQAEVTTPPAALMLRFNGRIEKRLSHVMLVAVRVPRRSCSVSRIRTLRPTCSVSRFRRWSRVPIARSGRCYRSTATSLQAP